VVQVEAPHETPTVRRLALVFLVKVLLVVLVLVRQGGKALAVVVVRRRWAATVVALA
jgi:hypothetical protein